MTRRSPMLAVLAMSASAVLVAGLAGPALADQGSSAQATTSTRTTKTTKSCKNTKKCTPKKTTTTTKTKSCKNPRKCGTATKTTSTPGTTSTKPTTTVPTTTVPTTTTTKTTSTTKTTTTVPTPTPTLSEGTRQTGTFAGLWTAGRVKQGNGQWLFNWPGVYMEGSFSGTSVGVNLEGQGAFFDVQIDGRTAFTLKDPDSRTHWVTGLNDGTHAFRLVKRSESAWATATFSGLVAGQGGEILAMPAPQRSRQIEFIGDSYTAGYGNLSTSRSCSDLNAMTNADVAFGALAARALDADYQLNAFSGRGMVRNYAGSDAGTSYRTYYDRALPGVSTDAWTRPSYWKPQVVVIGLGINDFSTSLNGNEAWKSASELNTAYRSAYKEFVSKLRSIYGPDTIIVASATYVHTGTAMSDNVSQVVSEFNAAGDANVRYWYYPNTGFDNLGCDWHPSANDHKLIAANLLDYLGKLPLGW